MLSEVLCFHRITQFEVKKSSIKLLSDSERPNGEKMCFRATQKDQMRKKCASERLRKNKKRKLRARKCDSNIEERDRVPCVSAYN